MADEGTICVCPQCGKKYRLKAGFDAASFSCKACAATVWIEGKPPAPKVEPGGRRRAGARRARGRGRGTTAAAGRGTTAGRAAAGRRGRREEAGEDREERRGGYVRPKSNANLYIAIGGLAVIGIVVVLVIMSGKDSPPPVTPVAQTPPGEGPADQPAGTAKTPPAKPRAAAPSKPVEAPSDAERPDPESTVAKTARAEGDKEENPAAPRSGRNLGGAKTRDRTRGTSRWDAPATLGHLKSTSPSERKQIDGLIALLMDPQAGRDSLDAKQKLAAIGKPAFPALLGAMAKVRDSIGDTDTIDERLIESSLKLADECLREMDGYLASRSTPPIRPGTDKKYIVHIIRLHYKRWKEKLETMDEMPGPYDPSIEFAEED